MSGLLTSRRALEHPMQLDEWDRKISPLLRGIEINAAWISHYASDTRSCVEKLSCAPAWESRAIAEARKVRGERARALAELDAALAKYDQVAKE